MKAEAVLYELAGGRLVLLQSMTVFFSVSWYE